MVRAARRAKRRTRPATRSARRRRHASAAAGEVAVAGFSGAPATRGPWLGVGDSAPGARRRSGRARPGQGGPDAGISSRDDIPTGSCGLPQDLLALVEVLL